VRCGGIGLNEVLRGRALAGSAGEECETHCGVFEFLTCFPYASTTLHDLGPDLGEAGQRIEHLKHTHVLRRRCLLLAVVTCQACLVGTLV
jgi:hypothetical protein